MSGHNRPSSKGREIFSHVLTDRQGQVQNVKAARVYVFGEGNLVEDDKDDMVEFEMPAVRARRGANEGGGSSFQQAAEEEEDVFYEKEIVDGETLQSLSLKYACPVSELKRVNNLMKDQDFFALRKLKIPMRRHGVLTEMTRLEQAEATKNKPRATTHNGAAPFPSDSDIPSDAVCSDVDVSDPEMHRVQTMSICDNFSKQGREANRFLKKMDTDLSKLRQSTVTERESLDEVISVLTNKSFYPLQNKRKVSGADWGIRWWAVVLAAVGVAIFLPAAIYAYVKFKS